MALVQLPPVIVKSAQIQHVKDAFKQLFGVECVKECSFEEQNIAYIKFLPMQSYRCLDFFNQLTQSLVFMYHGTPYVVDSQYINV
uniref:RRM domain-containing protein n=1 Tax=viral metagenome TaxID=1070528 RepID=A0A6C0BA66_9ZZZZ